ncbi:MAG: lipoyl(octanoyl) transferase LipB [Phycisphaerales bacterium]|nr:lipoyl(octanoyl) transferase LipB [Phycisphaerales bacterium]
MIEPSKPTRIDLGMVPYEEAYRIQTTHHEQVLESRTSGAPELGRILMVEHPPVITVTKRPDAASHVIASESLLAQHGVTLHQTDRGGDVTYHGPGQLVCYPILDLNAAKLRIHDYIRLLEASVIDTLRDFGIAGSVDPDATGVWIDPEDNPDLGMRFDQPAKVCAIGVRVRKWITLHGLAINLDPNMEHYSLLVPCGLAGRPVVSIRQLLGEHAPTMGGLSDRLAEHLSDRIMGNIRTETGTR